MLNVFLSHLMVTTRERIEFRLPNKRGKLNNGIKKKIKRFDRWTSKRSSSRNIYHRTNVWIRAMKKDY